MNLARDVGHCQGTLELQCLRPFWLSVNKSVLKIYAADKPKTGSRIILYLIQLEMEKCT